ncbi:hypothetical protein AAMO2058_001385400 [Amorphochlora amoebiformis]
MGNKDSKAKGRSTVHSAAINPSAPANRRRIAETAMAKREIKEVQLAMGCYWTGEGRLGAVRGVVSTQAGSCPGHFETVLVRYDSTVTSPDEISRKSGFRLVKGFQRFSSASSSQQKYYLQHSDGLSKLLTNPRQGGLVRGSPTLAAQMNSLIGGNGSKALLDEVAVVAKLTLQEKELLTRYYHARRR